ncbi:MAG: hypothetical protein NVS1B11_04920 [Terriglobales bacterium]
MAIHTSGHPTFTRTLLGWWKDQIASRSFGATLRNFVAALWEFVRESMPARRRERYGDVDFDWEHRVNTTGATVNWHDRLSGVFHSAYQPTQPDIFSNILARLKIDFREFLFIDIGSGKGRVLLMASDFPFRSILGVELLTSLHEVALENIKLYKNPAQKCFDITAVCADAREFVLPRQPSVIYLFNPLPEAGLAEFIENLERSLRENPRATYLLYHNPVLGHMLSRSELFKKIEETEQYAIYFHGII